MNHANNNNKFSTKKKKKMNIRKLLFLILPIVILVIGFIVVIQSLNSDYVIDLSIMIVGTTFGGVITIGVALLEIKHQRKMQEEENIINYKPIIYSPIKFDKSEAHAIRIDNNEDNMRIPNCFVYLKNSSKSCFTITNIEIIFLKQKEQKHFSKKTNFFVEKEMLFLISSFIESNCCGIFLTIKSIDERYYYYSVFLKDKKVLKLEEKELC